MSQSNKTLSDESYSVYSEYNKVLRNWLVGYGVGLPALIFANSKAFDAVLQSKSFRLMISLIAVGVLFQIASSLINKILNWYIYHSYSTDPRKEGLMYGLAEKISKKFWIDWSFDLLSILAFGYSTYLFIQAFPIGN